jgi:hypothetical protein
MSQEVDSRVVEMRFDNANFEKNTKQTISTIDRLMEKLQFKGAEKGFEKLDAAAKDVDFATMQTSLDRLESKFSSLNIVATTALVNITNKFVDAGEAGQEPVHRSGGQRLGQVHRKDLQRSDHHERHGQEHRSGERLPEQADVVL